MKNIWRKTMNIQIKKAIKAGNSSAVILPRAWLHKEVRIELVRKSPAIILKEVIEILTNQIRSEEIIGIYLIGSYARGEEDTESDIDVLVITATTDKKELKEGNYSILIVSEPLLQKKLDQDILPVGPMIQEAKPLLNAPYLKNINIKVTQKNIKWYLDTTEEKLALIERVLEVRKSKGERYVEDTIAYSLVLRARTLQIINKLIQNKIYSKKELISLLKRVSGGETLYQRYHAAKQNTAEKKMLLLEEAERTYTYIKKELALLKKTGKSLLAH